MYRLILLLCLFVSPIVSHGYSVLEHDTTKPYEVLPLVESPSNTQFIVGELDGYPEMIEFTSEEPFTLSFAIYALPGTTTPDFGGIAVQVQNPRGVKEINRLKAQDSSWETVVDPVSKLSFRQGASYVGEVASGTYRIEVSTPENYGKYLIQLGSSEVNSGYGETWRAVSQLYEFAGVTKLGMLRTPLVYYPLGIVILLVGFGYTIWRTRDRLPFLNRYA